MVKGFMNVFVNYGKGWTRETIIENCNVGDLIDTNIGKLEVIKVKGINVYCKKYKEVI